MTNRTRKIVLRVPVTPEEQELIRQKMALLHTRNFSAYARKMLIQIKFSSSTLKFMCQTSISCCLLRAAAFFGLAACFVSESCLRTEVRGLWMPLSRFSFLSISA